MKKRVGLIGSILLGAAMVTVGLSGNLVLAESDNGNSPGEIESNGCGPSGGQPSKCRAVPEPSSILLLGVGLAALGIWSWRRKSRES